MKSWDDLDDWLRSRPGDYSACVCDLAGHRLYGFQSDLVRPAASLIKVSIALTVEHYAGRGVLRLSDEVELTEAARVEGEGTVDAAAAGTRWRYTSLIEHMLRESDNTAGNLLIGLLEQHDLGMAAVNDYVQQLGARNTRLQRRFLDWTAARAGHDNVTTAGDMATLFVHLATRDQAVTGHLLRPLYDSVAPEKIVAGLPPGTRVAHKTGDLPGVEHDAGLVHGPGQSYVITLLGVDLPDVAIGQHTLAVASQLINNQMTQGASDGA